MNDKTTKTTPTNPPKPKAKTTKSLLEPLTTTTKTVFTTQDLNKIWQYENYKSLIQRISYLSKAGKIQKIKRGIYSFPNRPINELELANKIKTPSYISFETVLYIEGIIFQWDNRITLAAKDSREIQIQNDPLALKIVFRKIKDEILLNPTGIIPENNYFVASKERAMLDMLYISPNFTFDNLRSIDFAKLKEMAQIYNRASIFRAIERLEKYVR